MAYILKMRARENLNKLKMYVHAAGRKCFEFENQTTRRKEVDFQTQTTCTQWHEHTF